VNIDVLYAVSIWLLPVLIAVTFHEAAYGYVASRFRSFQLFLPLPA